MKPKFSALILLLAFCVIVAGTSLVSANPIIRADQTYFDINTGLYILKGNVYIEVKDRIITAGMARVSVSSLEVWGSGGIKVTQGDISFTGDSVYVYGSQDTAKIDGGVNFSRTGLSIHANKAEFNWKTKVGVFTGNVTITQNGRSWTTDSVRYNVQTNSIV
jgi:lipopolysaccharide export system protein LptA